MVRSSTIPNRFRWQAVPHIDLHWRFLEEHYLLYNSGSGHTHVLDPIAALLVRQITDRCRETTELVEGIGELLNLEPTEEFRTSLQQTLWQLEALGLIESVIP
jgi:PqqD family protein of HPr-rel-A system